MHSQLISICSVPSLSSILHTSLPWYLCSNVFVDSNHLPLSHYMEDWISIYSIFLSASLSLHLLPGKLFWPSHCSSSLSEDKWPEVVTDSALPVRIPCLDTARAAFTPQSCFAVTGQSSSLASYSHNSSSGACSSQSPPNEVMNYTPGDYSISLLSYSASTLNICATP